MLRFITFWGCPLIMHREKSWYNYIWQSKTTGLMKWSYKGGSVLTSILSIEIGLESNLLH